MLYYLSERVDGRIVLDRQPEGAILQKIEAPEPSTVRRLIEEEWVEVDQFYECFAYARDRVNEIGLFHTPEGWFRQESAYREYIHSRIGESD
jgi:hypothetical protein